MPCDTLAKLLFSFGLLGLTSCNSPDTSHNMPLIVAHRGASFDAPENTLVSFRLGWEQGADAIEGDYYLTADGHIICLHDATFKRTAGLDKKPSELTLPDIGKLDAGSWKGPHFAGERVPTLAEVLATVPRGKRALIEVKCGPEILPTLKKVIEESKVPIDQLRLICFDAKVIAESKKLMPTLVAYWLTGFKTVEGQTQKHPTADEILQTLKACDADGLDAHADLAVWDEAFVSKIRSAGYELHCWTVDDPQVAVQMKTLGIDSITTNRPRYIRNAIEPLSTSNADHVR